MYGDVVSDGDGVALRTLCLSVRGEEKKRTLPSMSKVHTARPSRLLSLTLTSASDKAVVPARALSAFPPGCQQCAT